MVQVLLKNMLLTLSVLHVDYRQHKLRRKPKYLTGAFSYTTILDFPGGD